MESGFFVLMMASIFLSGLSPNSWCRMNALMFVHPSSFICTRRRALSLAFIRTRTMFWFVSLL